MTKAPPSSAYFEAMLRFRPEPPDEETVERILEIYRAWWRKREQELAEQEGVGVVAPPHGTLGVLDRVRVHKHLPLASVLSYPRQYHGPISPFQGSSTCIPRSLSLYSLRQAETGSGNLL